MFGREAARRYERLITRALRDITRADDPPGSKPLEADPEIRLYHLQNSRARVEGKTVAEPRHLLVYRHDTPRSIVVLRLLHDMMDLPVHLT